MTPTDDIPEHTGIGPIGKRIEERTILLYENLIITRDNLLLVRILRPRKKSQNPEKFYPYGQGSETQYSKNNKHQPLQIQQNPKPRKNLTQETCPDRGSNPGPLRGKRACCRLTHSGGLVMWWVAPNCDRPRAP